MNRWIEKHLLLSMTAPLLPWVSLLALTIGRNTGDRRLACLFFASAGLLWLVLARYVLMPLTKRFEAIRKTTTLRSVKSLVFGATAGIGVLAIWMICLIGTSSAYLGGPIFKSLPCSVFTSFTVAHLLGGIAVALPFVAAAGVVHLLDAHARKDEVDGRPSEPTRLLHDATQTP